MIGRRALCTLLLSTAAVVGACDNSDTNSIVYPDAGGGGTTTVPDARPADSVADTRVLDAGVADAGVDAGADAGAAPTWTMVYSQVITTRCTPCHTMPNQIGITIGRLDMTSQATAYTNLVNVAAMGAACSGKGSRVMPGAPDSSVMYLKVSLDDPTPCGAKMPLGGMLTADEANTIEAWIMAGAHND